MKVRKRGSIGWNRTGFHRVLDKDFSVHRKSEEVLTSARGWGLYEMGPLAGTLIGEFGFPAST